jgi:hypothetical protein
VSSPSGFWGGPDPSKIEARFRELEARIDAILQRNNRGVGATSIQNPQGVTTFFSGPSALVTDPAGAPQWVTFIKDAAGQVRWELFDPDPIVSGYVQALWEWDHLGNIIRTTDILGGWAEPWFPIPMYPKFEQVDTGVFGFMSTAVNVAEQTLWEGRIGYVSHPYIGVDLQGGAATGTNSTRYRVKVNGTTAATYDLTGPAFFGGPVLVKGVGGVNIRSQNVPITVTAQSLSGSGTYTCQVWGMHMRQS